MLGEQGNGEGSQREKELWRRGAGEVEPGAVAGDDDCLGA